MFACGCGNVGVVERVWAWVWVWECVWACGHGCGCRRGVWARGRVCVEGREGGEEERGGRGELGGVFGEEGGGAWKRMDVLGRVFSGSDFAVALKL